MSKHDRWTLCIAVVAILIAVIGAIGTWKGVMQSKDYQGGFMSLVILPSGILLVVAANAYSVYRNITDARRCDKLKSDHEAELPAVKFAGGQAALLNFFQTCATDLIRRLEDMWHHWNIAGEVLIHPVDARPPIQWKNWSNDKSPQLLNERRDFMVLYCHHLHWLSLELPNFQSATTANGYPSDKEYPVVLANLKDHAEALNKLCDEVWKSGRCFDEHIGNEKKT